jgi:dihydrodipicolinate synthase/N-acetylneuraminate lyase
MKIGLVQRGIFNSSHIRSPLMAIEASATKDIRDALIAAGVLAS